MKTIHHGMNTREAKAAARRLGCEVIENDGHLVVRPPSGKPVRQAASNRSASRALSALLLRLDGGRR